MDVVPDERGPAQGEREICRWRRLERIGDIPPAEAERRDCGEAETCAAAA